MLPGGQAYWAALCTLSLAWTSQTCCLRTDSLPPGSPPFFFSSLLGSNNFLRVPKTNPSAAAARSVTAPWVRAPSSTTSPPTTTWAAPRPCFSPSDPLWSWYLISQTRSELCVFLARARCGGSASQPPSGWFPQTANAKLCPFTLCFVFLWRLCDTLIYGLVFCSGL